MSVVFVFVWVLGSSAWSMASGHPTLQSEPAQTDQMPWKDELVVAYYGRPGARSLGVLGRYSVEALKPMIRKKAAAYAKVTGKHVRPGFDIIYDLATTSPGPHKKYIIQLDSKKLHPYIKAAEQEGFIVFLETQLGKYTPQQAIHHLLKYITHPNVHIAIDPEFEVSNLKVGPGKKIGHIEAEWVNQVQATMDRYMRKNGIKEKKILLLHMFRHTMVRHKERLKHYDNIKLVFSLDGHGSPRLKVDIYNAIYTKRYATKVAGGFKLFFREDHPMMTPRQVMGLERVQGRKIKYPPKVITYQ